MGYIIVAATTDFLLFGDFMADLIDSACYILAAEMEIASGSTSSP